MPSAETSAAHAATPLVQLRDIHLAFGANEVLQGINVDIQRGQAVRKGQVIARSGESGYADRPELHFELRRGRTPVDPTTQLPHR